jgi:hypothetical protein
MAGEFSFSRINKMECFYIIFSKINLYLAGVILGGKGVWKGLKVIQNFVYVLISVVHCEILKVSVA